MKGELSRQPGFADLNHGRFPWSAKRVCSFRPLRKQPGKASRMAKESLD
jgi:hypothetical protein